MARRTRDERKRDVLIAAAERARTAQVAWASGLTFGGLAIDTGIDQAQIARDFGSKEKLLEELIDHILNPVSYEVYSEEMPDWIDELVSGQTSLAESVTMIAEALVDMYETSIVETRVEMMLWAAAEPGSVEWDRLGELYRQSIDRYVGEVERGIETVVAQGAVRRSDLSAGDIVATMNALLPGLAIRSLVAPDLIDLRLVTRVLKALMLSAVGPDKCTHAAAFEAVDALRRAPQANVGASPDACKGSALS